MKRNNNHTFPITSERKKESEKKSENKDNILSLEKDHYETKCPVAVAIVAASRSRRSRYLTFLLRFNIFRSDEPEISMNLNLISTQEHTVSKVFIVVGISKVRYIVFGGKRK